MVTRAELHQPRPEKEDAKKPHRMHANDDGRNNVVLPRTDLGHELRPVRRASEKIGFDGGLGLQCIRAVRREGDAEQNHRSLRLPEAVGELRGLR